MKDKLIKIQTELKAPKNQRNSFGNYNYRSCEDILEALKPHLKENDLLLTINDELVNIGERYYIKATVKITDGKEAIESTAYAREEEDKKGMDGSQITGACSSYARKYALNAMFLIDDNKDSDATNKHDKTKTYAQEIKPEPIKAEHIWQLTKLYDKKKGEVTTEIANKIAGLTDEQAVTMMMQLKKLNDREVTNA